VSGGDAALPKLLWDLLLLLETHFAAWFSAAVCGEFAHDVRQATGLPAAAAATSTA